MTHTSTQQPKAMRFTKKPVTIVASQWFKSGDHPAVRDISGSDDLFFTGMGGATLVEREKFGVIGTLESPNHLVTPGDWIITGVQGEHFPCKPDIFEATYAPQPPEAAPAQPGWCDGCSPDNCCGCGPCAAPAQVQPKQVTAMTDKELLELAAKAAELTNLSYCPAWKCMAEYDEHDGGFYKWDTYWNPLVRDSDALQLGILCRLNIKHGTSPSGAKNGLISCEQGFSEEFTDVLGQDPLITIRRAIVQVAAEIGKAMP